MEVRRLEQCNHEGMCGRKVGTTEVVLAGRTGKGLTSST